MGQVSKIEESRLIDPMVSMIERVAMSDTADFDKLERMLAMKEQIDAKRAMIDFADALAKARAEIPPIIKDATVDFTSTKGRTHYKHETLAGIAKVIDPILSKHGISYRFRTNQGNSGVQVTCIIQHRAGHIEETSLMGAPDQSGSKNVFQAVGSAVTYLQRYTLKAALGLSAEVDDDAQSASRQPDQKEPKRQSGPAPEAVVAAQDSLGNADSLGQLKAIWSDLPKPVQSVPTVISAKNARKSELDLPVAAGPIQIDDEILHEGR